MRYKWCGRIIYLEVNDNDIALMANIITAAILFDNPFKVEY